MNKEMSENPQEAKSIEYKKNDSNMIAIKEDVWVNIWSGIENPSWGNAIKKIEELTNVKVISGRYN
jgi:hypothetical protein